MNLYKKWQIVDLKDITISLDSRRIPIESSIRQTKKGKYPYYGASGIIDYIDDYIFEEETLLIGEDGANLLARTTPIAFKAVGKYWVNNHAHILKVTEKADINFLCYFFNQLDLTPYITGSAQPKLTADKLQKLKIPLPPLPEQKQIAAILEKCDRLRRTRRYSLQLSETFLQSVFLEMFGDLITNQMGWRIKNLDDVADIASGVTKGQKFNGKQTVQVPYMRVANVQDGYLDLTDIKIIEALPQEVEQLKLQKGDILMTEGGDYDKLGRGAIWHGQIENCIHQNHIFRVRTNRKIILPEFFAKLLLTQYTKLYFLQCSKQTTNLATINMTQLKALPVPLPPLPLQEKFAQIVQKHDRIRTQQREAERQAEHLFQTLLHRAFRGELTSSDCNEVDISALSAENHPQQPKPKSTDKAENFPIPATQPQTNALQLTLPGLE
ncbi:restriction endonuclease subunit S [Anabaena sphaerica FACHB-251]|uniref:Restriction endonuclease subunit S n=1 Tax=Anabaena sphaerica FACHB-251 TaxID=2692883 RepID=A0A926WCS3_9NOST|nr:restriction endonuclease subunit S [Anabaena sphaerica]MBD2292008.1 restriction endonuclease subunit S [Anabaena sphaerica FACHB-251]